MPVSPSPEFVTLRYKKVVGLGLAFQAINLAQGEFMGHRVRLSLPVDLMNEYFTWQRGVGEVRPTGRFTNDAGDNETFKELLTWALSSPMTDVDGVANGLNYSSEALDTYNDSKRDTAIVNVDAEGADIQDKHYSANDLVMAYVLFKCFGSSSFDAADIIYNLEDAFGMLSSAALAEAVKESLAVEDLLALEVLEGDEPKSGNRGKVDEMFRALLAADPKRFMKNGKQIDGLFETNADVSGSNADASGAGNWCLKVGDIIEVPIKLYFTAPVTVLSVTDEVRQPSSLTPANPETVVIKGEPGADADTAYDPNEEGAAVAARENTMSVRLQLLCSAPRGENSGATSEVGATTTPALKLVTQMNLIFYNGPSYPAQSAIAVITSGGAAAPTYDVSGEPAGVTIASNGVLTFDRSVSGAAAINGRFPVTLTATSGAESVSADIFISIDDGTGSSNATA